MLQAEASHKNRILSQSETATIIKMEIIYEDNHIIAINKACGEIVMIDQTGDAPLTDQVKEYIKQKYLKPGNVFLGLPHRIDRPTSGIVLMARTSKVLTRLNKMFQKKDEIKKIYWAVVNAAPDPPDGKLEHYITRSRDVNKSYAREKETEGSKFASLSYRTIAKSDRYYLLEIELHTGRHHQIRAQLHRIGIKIKGDLKYGYPRSNPDGGIHLHARRVEMIHPVRKEPLIITAPPPDDPVWNVFVKMVESDESGRI